MAGKKLVFPPKRGLFHQPLDLDRTCGMVSADFRIDWPFVLFSVVRRPMG